MTTAIQAVNTNTVWAALYFPKNYTLCRIHVENEGTYATTEDLDGSSVHVWLGSSGKFSVFHILLKLFLNEFFISLIF